MTTDKIKKYKLLQIFLFYPAVVVKVFNPSLRGTSRLNR